MSRVSRPSLSHPQPPSADAAAVSAFLRSLADRAQADPAFAAQVHAALRESGLLPTATADADPADAPALVKPPRRPAHTGAAPANKPAALALDPFAVLRDRGEPGLQASLESLDLVSLRQLVRAHRLDPARISARWTARDRVIALIVDQVRARANHGKAFSRV